MSKDYKVQVGNNGGFTDIADYQRQIIASGKTNVEKKEEVKEVKEEKDMINPSHYAAGTGVECIQVMQQQFTKEEVMAFCKLNSFKYLFRCGHKNAELEEMKKVQWYVAKYIELAEKKED